MPLVWWRQGSVDGTVWRLLVRLKHPLFPRYTRRDTEETMQSSPQTRSHGQVGLMFSGMRRFPRRGLSRCGVSSREHEIFASCKNKCSAARVSPGNSLRAREWCHTSTFLKLRHTTTRHAPERPLALLRSCVREVQESCTCRGNTGKSCSGPARKQLTTSSRNEEYSRQMRKMPGIRPENAHDEYRTGRGKENTRARTHRGKRDEQLIFEKTPVTILLHIRLNIARASVRA